MRPPLIRLGVVAISVQLLLGCNVTERCTLPEHWQPILNARGLHAPIVVRVELTSSTQIRWNGVSISRNRFFEHLRTSARQAPVPFLAIRWKTQDCESIQILNQIYDIYPCRQGACGLELE